MRRDPVTYPPRTSRGLRGESGRLGDAVTYPGPGQLPGAPVTELVTRRQRGAAAGGGRGWARPVGPVPGGPRLGLRVGFELVLLEQMDGLSRQEREP